MTEVTAIKIPQGTNKLALENFSFGIEHKTWGFPDRNNKADGGEGIPKGRVILFGIHFESGPGQTTNDQRNLTPDEYAQGTMQRIVVAIATEDSRKATKPLWPDEVESGSLKYDFHVPIAVLGEITDLDLTLFSRLPHRKKKPLLRGEDPMGLAAAFQYSALVNAQPKKATLTDSDVANLTSAIGRNDWNELVTDFSTASSSPDEIIDENERQVREKRAYSSVRAGYQPDPEKRKIIEKYAVNKAVKHYEELGWTVTELGKPYDLDCTKPTGENLRVEVKGTTSKAGELILTVNEVHSARQYPSELFIVADIIIKGTSGSLSPSGGNSFVFEKWFPAPKDLSPQQYRYRVPWDQATAL